MPPSPNTGGRPVCSTAVRVRAAKASTCARVPCSIIERRTSEAVYARGLLRMSYAVARAETVKTALERHTPAAGGKEDEESAGRMLKAFRMPI